MYLARTPYAVLFLAFFFGLLTSLGHAPVHSLLAFGLGISGLLWLRDYKFKTGFLFGLGYWIGTLHWIIFAFDVYDMRRLGMGSVLILCSYLACYQGLSYTFLKKTPYPKIAFCCFWVLGEYIQGHLGDFSFPWGYVAFMCPSLEIAQAIHMTGVLGFSFVMLLLCVGIFFGSRFIKIGSLVSLSLLWFLGYQRLSNHPTLSYPVNLRLIQPSITQKDKHDIKLFQKNMNIHLALSNLPGEKKLDAILWPETAFLTKMTQRTVHFLTQNLKQDSYLITGAIVSHKDWDFLKEQGIFNSLFVLKNNKILDHYEKQYLVPFGEHNPIPFMQGSFDVFSKGKEDKVITPQGLPSFRPLICFEAIFPLPSKGEKWRLNLTNDAWYGESFGPYQHLKIIQMRTIESGIPLVRVANNGISAVIDSLGRILYQLKLNRMGIIDFHLPK